MVVLYFVYGRPGQNEDATSLNPPLPFGAKTSRLCFSQFTPFRTYGPGGAHDLRHALRLADEGVTLSPVLDDDGEAWVNDA